MSLFGSAIDQFGGTVAGGFSQASADNYQAQIAKNNATIEKQNAAYASQAGASQTEQEGLKARGQNDLVRAGEAANNLDVNSGSAADVQVSQRELGALDTATVAHNAALEAYGYKTQASNFTSEADQYSRAASLAPVEGVLKGFSSILSSAPDLPDAFKWMQSDSGSAATSAASGGADAAIGDLVEAMPF